MTDDTNKQSFDYPQSIKSGHFIEVSVKGFEKKPVYNGWQKYKAINPQSIIDAGYQVGFALGTEVLVIDLDLYKKEGKASAQKLLDKYPILAKCPRVNTMRNGKHLFLSCKTGTGQLSKTLKEIYPGVDFLRQRMFVMCAGNPNYRWQKKVCNWSKLPIAPEGLITELLEPVRSGHATTDLDHTVIDADQLRAILYQLDPNDFNGVEHPKGMGKHEWLQLMMACCAAVGFNDDQQGYDVFDEWSRQVPYYADTGCPRPRWRSIAYKERGVNISSLYRVCDLEGVDWREASGLPPKPVPNDIFKDFSFLIDDDRVLEQAPTESKESAGALSSTMDVQDTDLISIIEDILLEKRDLHDKLFGALSNRCGKSLTDLQYRAYKILFIGTDTDMNLKLSDRLIAIKLLRVVKYMGMDHVPTYTEGDVYIYGSDGCWQRFDKDALDVFVMDIADNCYGVNKLAHYEGIRRALRKMIVTKFSDPEFFLNAHKGVAFGKRFFELRDNGVLNEIPIASFHRIRHKFDFDFNSTPNPTPLYDQFMALSVDDLSDVNCNRQGRIIEQFMGASLFGLGTSYAKSLLIQGSGSNGKSQLLDIMEKVTPNKGGAASFSLEGLRDDGAIAGIYDKTLVLVPELAGSHSKLRYKGSKFKALVSGDRMSTRRLYGDRFDFRFNGSLVMVGNKPPVFDDAGLGLERRIISISMDRKIPESSKIRDIGKLIAHDEIEGVIVRAVLAAIELVKSGTGFETSGDHKFIENQDTVKTFVRNRCTLGKDLQTHKSSLYGEYCEYCDYALCEDAIGKQAFNRELMFELGLKEMNAKDKQGKSTRVWRGITLN